MKGTNKLRVCKTQMIAIVQDFYKYDLGKESNVTDVSVVSSGYDGEWFEITFAEKEEPDGTKTP